GPDLVGAAGGVGAQERPRSAVAVEPEERTERTELEPPDDQLAEIRIVRITTMEAPDVGRPPRDAGEPDVQACSDLLPQRVPGRGDVARPDGGTVSLAA